MFNALEDGWDDEAAERTCTSEMGWKLPTLHHQHFNIHIS